MRSLKTTRPAGHPARAARLLAMLAVAAFTPLAAAQGPSFSAIPSAQPTNTSASSLSASGRYVTGVYLNDILYRWDRQTGAFVTLAGENTTTASIVIDSGLVFSNRENGLGRPAYRWDPASGQIVYVPALGFGPDFYFNRVARDGQYAVGFWYNFSGERVLYDFTSTSPTWTPLSASPGSTAFNQVPFAGITLPINGARIIRGTLTYDGGTVTNAAIWPVGQTYPIRDNSLTEAIEITPRNEFTLGRINDSLFVRGDGPDRGLPAPLTPLIMTNPVPRHLSDDGRVVGGIAYIGDHYDAVIWRKDQTATTLRAILQSAGVSVPAWTRSTITELSADGSTVAGNYFLSSDLNHGIGFVAVLPALNDNCETARIVTYGSVTDSTSGARRAGVSGSCHSEGTAPDVWFRFTALATETVTIDTCGSSFDTTLTVFGASSCASLGSPVACNDDASPACSENAANSRLSLSVNAGLTYFIRVSGWNGAFGSVRLTITAPARPINDTCENAISIGSGSGAFFNNTGALTDPRPNCNGAGTPFADLWYRGVVAETGRMTYSTCGSSINTVLIAYPGSACGDINTPAIACGQSSAACPGSNGTRLTVPCVAGETQLVRVGGLFGATGSGQITARFACDASVLNNYAVSVFNAQPRGYWRFEDSGTITVADAMRADPFSCGNYPGEYRGSLLRPGGFQGKALSLTGDGAHVRIPDAPHVTDPAACNDPNFGATLEAWVRTTDPLAGVVLTNRTAPGELSLTLVIGYNSIGIPNTAGRVMFISDGPGVFFGGASVPRVDDGRWHHIVGRRTVNGEGTIELQVWIDGVQSWYELPGVGFAYSGVNGPHWLVGHGTAWATQDAAFNGQIDEVAIYCGAMAPGTIANHYTLGRPCPADFNADAAVNSQDFFDFLNALFAGNSLADVNRDGFINSQDFFDFLTAFYGAC